jgi:Zn-dependent metalloprotease/subtilisin-like proprotein convertase family protein
VKSRAALATTLGMTLVASMALFAQPAAAQTPGLARAAFAADPLSSAVAAADRAVSSGLDVLRKGVDEKYERRAVTPGAGGMYYMAYERTYRGLRVVGGDAVVVADSAGVVRHTSAAAGPTRGVAVTPRISASAATEAARAKLSRVDDTAAAQLVVLAWGAQPRLAWDAVVSGIASGKPSIQHVFVDALTGAILDSYDEVRAGSGNGYYNGQVTIATSGSGSSYSMTDPTRTSVRCGGQNGSAYTGTDDAWGNGSGTNLETACVDTLYAAQKEWDMLSQWLGRNGFNGSGGGFPARVGLADVNAYWNGSYTNFGHNQANDRQATAIDVVAHEYGHAIFQTTPGGAGSGNENGGINEATGDIFGALTEHFANNPNDPPDYLVGEEINLTGAGEIRNMYNPSAEGDPNCWSTSLPNTEVHAAAGPLNHWFYLLAEGSTPGGGKPSSPICSGGPASVTGIGIQKAGKIFLGALMRKTSSWRYINVRSASLAAVVELYGAASTECATTKAAWNAVSVPVQSGEPTCTAPGNDFSLSLSPTSGTVQAGQSVTTTVGTQTVSGSAQTVSLSASGLPSGATAAFNPTSVTSGNSSTLTIATGASTPSGTYQVTVTGTGSATHSVTYTLTVGGGGPGPSDPPDISVDNVRAHLQQFQNIASTNGGNRRAAGPGYTASMNYVYDKLAAAGYQVVKQNCTSGCTSGAGPNVIADWPGGDASQVFMFGAHLDGVSSGAGINDNASGSAVLLEVALKLAELNPALAKHVRFGWWTDEEQGLNGSEFYVNNLPQAERTKIKGYFNFDMVGSTNYGYFIDNITGSLAGNLKGYFDSVGVQTEEMGECCSDDGPFRNVGIPTTFLSTGAGATKSAAQAQKWGGSAGQSFDPCYHASCDSFPSNISTTALDRNADATAWALWKVAVGDTPPPTRDFSLSLSPAAGTVQAGQSATSTVSTQTTAGTAQTVNLSASGLPSGATASFSPSSVTSGSSSTLTIATTPATPAGTYSVTVSGAGETATRTAAFSLTVQSTSGNRTFSNGNNYNILDYGIAQSPVTSTATGAAVSPVSVSFTIVHSCSQDLDIWLRGPNGLWYLIKDKSYGACTAWSGPRTYSVPVSQQAGGQWLLYVRDNYANDTGYLDTWSITV